MSRIINMVGRRFGRLNVIADGGRTPTGQMRWLCVCECGKQKTIIGCDLRNGKTVSCGCFKDENTKKRSTIHGHAIVGKLTKEYRAWRGIITRCYYIKGKHYKNYGGRGITVCPRWLHSFENFLADIGPAPFKTDTVERDDTNGLYEPANCRWASRYIQSRNTRANRYLLHNGKSLILTDWASLLKIPVSSLHKKLKTMSLSEIINA